MDKIALLFAGQGAQYPGMGKDFYETVPAAAEVFDQLEQQRPGTMQQCFYGSKEELSITINTQPCLFAVIMPLQKQCRTAEYPSQQWQGFHWEKFRRWLLPACWIYRRLFS